MSNKLCPICKINYNNLWKHKRSSHLDIDDYEFIRRYLNLTELPKCKTCKKLVVIDYSRYRFGNTCGSPKCRSNGFTIDLVTPVTCDKCHRTFRNSQGYRAHSCNKLDDNGNYVNQFILWRLRQPPEVISEVAKRGAQTRKANGKSYGYYINRSMSAERKHELAVLRGLASVRARKFDGKNYYVSKSEKFLYFRLKRLFPQLTIFGFDSDYRVSIYKPDIYIKELNLILEVDGRLFHDVEKDIKRDKFIKSILGCKFRRLDADYVSRYLTDSDLIWIIFNELIQNSDYWDRIPISEIGYWKWDPHKIGPNLLIGFSKNE